MAGTKGLMEPAKRSRQVISPRTVHSAAFDRTAVAHWTQPQRACTAAVLVVGGAALVLVGDSFLLPCFYLLSHSSLMIECHHTVLIWFVVLSLKNVPVLSLSLSLSL